MERPEENPRERAAWRKTILRQMFKGLQRPHFQEKTWEMLFDKRSKEYSFIIGNTILFIDQSGNPVNVKILDNGRVRTSTQIVKMTTLLDHALNHYARTKGVQFSDEENGEEELQGTAMDVRGENEKETEHPLTGIVKKIRKRLKRTSP